jgi:3-hexulose-6-phosphate synthase
MERLQGLVDIAEIGTPVIIRDGVNAVRLLRSAFPELTILADLKIVDGGYLEASLAFKAGANIVTALALADDSTIRETVRAAADHGGEVMVDMMGIRRPRARALRMEELGALYICLHTSKDALAAETRGGKHNGDAINSSKGKSTFSALRGLCSALTSAGSAIAGGITAQNAAVIAALGTNIIVVGSAITSAPDQRAAAMAVRAALSAKLESQL